MIILYIIGFFIAIGAVIAVAEAVMNAFKVAGAAILATILIVVGIIAAAVVICVLGVKGIIVVAVIGLLIFKFRNQS